jgi:hypothetical protein
MKRFDARFSLAVILGKGDSAIELARRISVASFEMMMPSELQINYFSLPLKLES